MFDTCSHCGKKLAKCNKKVRLICHCILCRSQQDTIFTGRSLYFSTFNCQTTTTKIFLTYIYITNNRFDFPSSTIKVYCQNHQSGCSQQHSGTMIEPWPTNRWLCSSWYWIMTCAINSFQPIISPE